MTTPPRTLRTPAELADAGLIPPSEVARLDDVAARYAVAVTPAIADLIRDGAPDDPIARQFIPSVAELTATSDERADPIGDRANSPVPGLVHRYPDRVLLKVTHTCPVYCRFCFRREMVGPSGPPTMAGAELEAALAYIRARPAIHEVILTGGDPLMLSARRIRELTAALAAIPHVEVLRWHSRVPVADPGRITPELVAALADARPAVYVAIHANHVAELGAEARAAISRLARAGIPLLGQTVLLRDVNDDAAALEALFRALVALKVRPYYLHHADLAPGTAHFRTSIAEGQALMRALRGRLSGFALPTYVLDVPGGFGKVPVGPAYIDESAGIVRDPTGRPHPYPPVSGSD